MSPEFHKHDPTHMFRSFSMMIQKCPEFAGFWGLDNKVRMRMLSNLIVSFIYSAQTQKNKKRMLYIRLLIIYLKKNYKEITEKFETNCRYMDYEAISNYHNTLFRKLYCFLFFLRNNGKTLKIMPQKSKL